MFLVLLITLYLVWPIILYIITAYNTVNGTAYSTAYNIVTRTANGNVTGIISNTDNTNNITAYKNAVLAGYRDRSCL